MPRPKRKWFRRLLIASCVLAVIVLALYWLVLPRYVKSRIHHALLDAGISDASFQQDRISLKQLELSGIEIGRPEWLAVDSISISYSLSLLWTGRVRNIEIDNASWNVRWNDQGFDWGFHPTAKSGSMHDLPWERLNIRNLTLIVERNGVKREIPVSGSVTRVADGNFSVAVQVSALAALGSVDFTGGSPRGQMTAQAPAFSLEELDPWRDLVPQLADVQTGGTCAIDATIKFDGGTIDPLVKLTFENLALSSPSWSGAIESASGSVSIKSLSPLSTPPNQQFQISKAKVGTMEITDANLTFTVEHPESIVVQKASWSMGELGQFIAASFTINPTQPTFSTEVICKNLGLGPWLSMLTSDRATGAGRLDGRVRMTIQPGSKNLILFDSGLLQSQADKGWIKSGDVETLSQLLDQSRSEGTAEAEWNMIKTRITDALKDFEYSNLTVQLVPENGDVTCRIETAGKGRQGADAQEIGGLTVNVHDFGTWFNRALRIKAAIDRME